jgi:hypothetical protein
VLQITYKILDWAKNATVNLLVRLDAY